MKEYGGYISLETRKKEYYTENKGYDILRLNAARYAIIEAFVDSGCKKLWIPIYTCESIYRALKEAKIVFCTYNINLDFTPKIDNLEEHECILVTNYFGILGSVFCRKIEKYKCVVIYDNTQAFYCPPIISGSKYTIYSPRKFFGVCDGAYLITKKFNRKHTYIKDFSYDRGKYLLKSVECGTNQSYNDYLCSEEILSLDGVKEMSALTRAILGNIDYEYAAKCRKENFRFLHSILKKYNEIQDETIELTDSVPMVYPLLTRKNKNHLRDFLVKNKIYVPQWWKWVLTHSMSNEFERNLSEYLYPLPIDQRYDLNDMHKIYEVVRTGVI